MTLATHAVVGGAVASLFPNHPITAFLVGFFSHFVLDAIPHWDYEILSAYANPEKAKEKTKNGSFKIDKNFLFDLLRTGSDAFLGLVLVFLIWYPIVGSQWKILLLGAIGGVFPDFLQLVYARFPHQPMSSLQKFHVFLMHADRKLKNSPIIGILSQAFIALVAVVLAKYLAGF